MSSETTEEIFPAKFQRFFIFNSSWGPREENEDQKVVYFFPKNEQNQSKHVGLVEALTKFMSVFSHDSPANIQHNARSKSVFKEFEDGFQMVLTVALPNKVKEKAKHQNDQLEIVHLHDQLHDNVLNAVLERSYELFKIFTGGFTHHGSDHDSIRVKCNKFFDRFLPSLSFSGSINDLFPAVQFLTLESLDFLNVQSFVHKVENDFGCVDKSLFLHHGNIVWSGLQQKETQLLYFYVYNTLLPSFSSKISANSGKSSPFSGHQGQFLTGPTTTLKLSPDQVNSLRIPKVFIGQNLKEYQFLVYHAIQSTLCLLIPSEVDFTVDFFKRLDGHLGPKLTNISADLLDVFGRNSNLPSADKNFTDPSILSPSICVNPSILEGHKNLDEDLAMVYYNGANKAMKNKNGQEFFHAISDLNEDAQNLIQNEEKSLPIKGKLTTEVSVKLPSDDWIVSKKVDQRQLYLAFRNKSTYSLLDISDEADKMMANEFKNICLPP